MTPIGLDLLIMEGSGEDEEELLLDFKVILSISTLFVVMFLYIDMYYLNSNMASDVYVFRVSCF